MSGVFVISMLVMLVLTGGIFAITPLLVKHDEVFAVTIPAAHYYDPEITKLRQSYVVIILLFTVLTTALTALSALVSERVFSLSLGVSIVGIMVCGAILYLRNRKQIQLLKEREGWERLVQNIASAAISTPSRATRIPSMWWNLLYLPIILGTLAISLALYSQIPDQIPMQTDFAGHVLRYAPKSIGTILFIPFIQAFMAIVMTFVSWTITRSRRDIDPLHPHASAERSAQFSRVWFIFTLVIGVTLIASFALMPISFAGIITLDAAGIILLVTMLLIVAACIVLSLKYGQSGARLSNRVEDENALARDDDKYWKFGVFYVNRDDPALFLPKRFGVGWTSNFGRPLTWVFIGGLIFLFGALGVATYYLGY